VSHVTDAQLKKGDPKGRLFLAAQLPPLLKENGPRLLLLVTLGALGRTGSFVRMAPLTGFVREVLAEAFDLARPFLVTNLAVLQLLLMFLVLKGDVTVFCRKRDGIRCQDCSSTEHDECYCDNDLFHFAAPFLFGFFTSEL
jgi:hypothetical protein